MDQSSKILPMNINLSSKQTIVGHDASGSLPVLATQKILNASMGGVRDRSIVPQKYNNLLHRTTQIPRSSIIKLIGRMDTNNDGYITSEDIVRFSNKCFLFFDQELAESMFREAACHRIVSFKEQYEQPINVDEILGAVQLHYKKNDSQQWVENPRPHRQQWIVLLSAIGEQLPNRRDLSPLKVDKVRDMHEFNSHTYKPTLTQSKSLLAVRAKPYKVYTPPYRAEAGLIVNNTEHVREATMEMLTYEQLAKVEPFEKVVNGKMYVVRWCVIGSKMIEQAIESEYPTIAFETKAFYQEAERLSRHPELYLKGRNPIYTFLPENTNYQAKQQIEQESFIQQKRQTQVKFDKSFGSINSPEFHESAFFQEIDELYYNACITHRQKQEDLESITMLQDQPWLKSKKHQQSQPSFRKMSSIQIPNLPLQHAQRMKHMVESPPQPSMKPIFVTTFKVEDCRTVKSKLAINEPVTDKYDPPSAHQFREEYVHLGNRVEFKTRTKVDALVNPHATSEHDQRPQFAIEAEMTQKVLHEIEEKRIMNEQLGIFLQPKDWINTFPLADRHHNFVDKRRPEFIDKGAYREPSEILTSLLRADVDITTQFKLFHRQLRRTDKNLFLGDVKDSKF